MRDLTSDSNRAKDDIMRRKLLNLLGSFGVQSQRTK